MERVKLGLNLERLFLMSGSLSSWQNVVYSVDKMENYEINDL